MSNFQSELRDALMDVWISGAGGRLGGISIDEASAAILQLISNVVGEDEVEGKYKPYVRNSLRAEFRQAFGLTKEEK